MYAAPRASVHARVVGVLVVSRASLPDKIRLTHAFHARTHMDPLYVCGTTVSPISR